MFTPEATIPNAEIRRVLKYIATLESNPAMPLRTAMTATARPLLVHAPGTPASQTHGASGEETTPQFWSRMVWAVVERANAEKVQKWQVQNKEAHI